MSRGPNPKEGEDCDECGRSLSARTAEMHDDYGCIWCNGKERDAE